MNNASERLKLMKKRGKNKGWGREFIGKEKDKSMGKGYRTKVVDRKGIRKESFGRWKNNSNIGIKEKRTGKEMERGKSDTLHCEASVGETEERKRRRMKKTWEKGSR